MMSSRKPRPPGIGNVVKGPFNKRKPNPVEEEKPSAGINVKQIMLIGSVTALTGTIVGAVAMEIYRHLRPNIPIPMPVQPGQVVQNPGYPQPQPQLPLGWAPQPQPQPQANYWSLPSATAAPAFVPAAVQQVGAFPPQPPQQLVAPVYQSPIPALAPAPAPAPYQNPAPAPQTHSVPISPQAPSQPTSDQDPLSLPELAQWQRRLEGWERNLDRRDHYGDS